MYQLSTIRLFINNGNSLQCDMWGWHDIGLYLLKENGITVMANSNRYADATDNLFEPELWGMRINQETSFLVPISWSATKVSTEAVQV